MKQNKMNKSLELKKQTIAALDSRQLNAVNGGGPTDPNFTDTGYSDGILCRTSINIDQC